MYRLDHPENCLFSVLLSEHWRPPLELIPPRWLFFLPLPGTLRCATVTYCLPSVSDCALVFLMPHTYDTEAKGTVVYYCHQCCTSIELSWSIKVWCSLPLARCSPHPSQATGGTWGKSICASSWRYVILWQCCLQVNIPLTKRHVLKDLYDDKELYAFSDGVGIITPETAEAVLKQLPQLSVLGEVPSAFQIRWGGSKGVLAVWCALAMLHLQCDVWFISKPYDGFTNEAVYRCVADYSISLTFNHQDLIFLSAVFKWNSTKMTWMAAYRWVLHVSGVKI